MKKTCRKCGEEKGLDEFYFRYRNKKRKNYPQSICKVCSHLSVAEWKNSNKDKFKEYVKASYIRTGVKEKAKKDIDYLNDKYLKTKIQAQFGLPFSNISQNIIQAKREQLQALRLHKKIEEVIKNGNV